MLLCHPRCLGSTSLGFCHLRGVPFFLGWSGRGFYEDPVNTYWYSCHRTHLQQALGQHLLSKNSPTSPAPPGLKFRITRPGHGKVERAPGPTTALAVVSGSPKAAALRREPSPSPQNDFSLCYVNKVGGRVNSRP